MYRRKRKIEGMFDAIVNWLNEEPTSSDNINQIELNSLKRLAFDVEDCRKKFSKIVNAYYKRLQEEEEAEEAKNGRRAKLLKLSKEELINQIMSTEFKNPCEDPKWQQEYCNGLHRERAIEYCRKGDDKWTSFIVWSNDPTLEQPNVFDNHYFWRQVEREAKADEKIRRTRRK